jgi:hypothetical protein
MKPTMKPNLAAAIQDRRGWLALQANTPRCKLEGEGVLVDRLQELGSKCLVDLDRSAEDTAAQHFMLESHLLVLLVVCLSSFFLLSWLP